MDSTDSPPATGPRGTEVATEVATRVAELGTRIGSDLGAPLGKELQDSALLLGLAVAVLGVVPVLASTTLLLG